MNNPTIDIFSSVPVHVIPMFESTIFGGATAFFWSVDSQGFLITNWHVVTGRHFQTTETNAKHAGTPNKLRIQFPLEEATSPPIDIDVELYDNEAKPIWYVHPLYKNHVDVVAIPITKPDMARCFAINSIPTVDLIRRVGMRVFIVGFPFGRSPTGLPIWKQGTFATEPSLSPKFERYMLIDSASRPGMSGSPVIQREFGHIQTADGQIGTVKDGDGAGSIVGIYTGRLATNDFNDPQLGIVWPISLVEEIVNSRFVDDGNWFKEEATSDIRSNKPYTNQ